MKKIVTVLVVVMGLMLTGKSTSAQNKFGYVSMQELITSMPEYKKADTSMNDFRNALAQQFEDMKKEFNEQDSLLSSKDTAKFNKAQLEVKRRTLAELYTKVTGFQQQAQEQLQAKQQELIAPIQKRAIEAIQNVAKENGYTYVLQKEALYVYPNAEDLLPLVKKKLNLK